MTTQTMHAPSNLKRIEIRGLYGDRNVRLNFREPYKILVDSNGSGKTTSIYLIVNLLQENRSRLSKYSFDSISFLFKDDRWVQIDREEISKSKQSNLHESVFSRPHRKPKIISSEEYLEQRAATREKEWREALEKLSEIYGGISIRSVKPEEESEQHKLFLSKVRELRDFFPFHRILYFPTYRLIEESLEGLGLSSTLERQLSDSDRLIQFGMEDVEQQLQEIISEIKELSLSGFSEISSRMVDELIDGMQDDEIDYESLEKEEVLKIILDRSGDNISQENKSRLIELVNSSQIRKPEMRPLAYFLSNLVEIYQKQLEKDNDIKRFVKTVNEYFVEGSEKYFDYDESNLKIQVKSQRNESIVPLEKLSSGEKQIVSVFSKLYLQGEQQYAIFFDEPELSLSMEWQKKLLEDIVNSGRCSFLLAATHSPFIFDNSLAKYADVLEVEYL